MHALQFGLALIILINLACGQAQGEEKKEASDRRQKLVSMFQVIRFPNNPCMAGNNKNGTCYTAEECSGKGGTNSGMCADGFGICCVFTLTCGDRSSENCTFFDSQSVTNDDSCTATICKASTDVCQLRLDFDSFVIAGPSSLTTTAVVLRDGQVSAATTKAAVPATLASRCLTDTFSVAKAAGQSPPVICGSNTGEHMYANFDSTGGCVDLVFQLGRFAVGTSLPTRQWSIKVSQYSCEFANLAPPGCTQYFFGKKIDNVQTYNFNNGQGQHLANQDQVICVRRERGNCRICWTTVIDTDFMLSGPSKATTGFNKGSVCCNFKTVTSKMFGFDCVNIPGAVKEKTMDSLVGSNVCGRRFVTASKKNTAATLCSTRTPFLVHFRSDAFEFDQEAKKADMGFKLIFVQDAMNCKN